MIVIVAPVIDIIIVEIAIIVVVLIVALDRLQRWGNELVSQECCPEEQTPHLAWARRKL